MTKKNKDRERNLLKLNAEDDTLDFGRLVAENDEHLAQYYVSEQRYLRRAIDIEDPATFFVGPKGMGKSAILKMVQLTKAGSECRVISIRPDDLAFSALANVEATSPIIAESAKNQWLFKALWDYVLAMEVLRREFPNASELSGWFTNIFRGQFEKEARKLISMSQGEETSLTVRILQLVKEVELSGEYAGAKITGKAVLDKENAKSGEPLHLLSLVNSVARKLRDNVKHSYYLLIDDLDLYWNDTPTQNAFLASLFTSLSHFSRPPRLKAIVALRENIYNSLPLVDRDKLHDVVIPVRWDFDSVRTIVEERILFKLQVQRKEIWGGLFPEDAFKAIWKHSNGRPREAIRLATVAAVTADTNGHKQITQHDMETAIRDFSIERLKEITGEFEYKYPGLERIVKKMNGGQKEFPLGTLKNILEIIALEVDLNEPGADRYAWARGYSEDPCAFARLLLECGILWVKLSRTDEAVPYDPSNPVELTATRWFAVHPMFAPGLGLVGGA